MNESTYLFKFERSTYKCFESKRHRRKQFKNHKTSERDVYTGGIVVTVIITRQNLFQVKIVIQP